MGCDNNKILNGMDFSECLKIKQENPQPCDCDGICCPCDDIPPNLDMSMCVQPYIKLYRHDDLETNDEQYMPWAFYENNDICLAGSYCVLQCCGCRVSHWTELCTGTPPNYHPDFEQDWIAFTFPWLSLSTAKIEGEEYCSFGRTIARQGVYLTFHYKIEDYHAWKSAKDNGTYTGMTREEELAASGIKCIRQIWFGCEYLEKTFRFQGANSVSLARYFWLPEVSDLEYENSGCNPGHLKPSVVDAGTVNESITRSQESVPGPYNSPTADQGSPGWTISIIEDEETLDLLGEGDTLPKIEINMRHSIGGKASGGMIYGSDCQLRYDIPPCHRFSSGIPIQVGNVPDATDSWHAEVTSASGDPLNVPVSAYLMHQSFGSHLEVHTGDPGSECFYPCPYQNPTKRAVMGYEIHRDNYDDPFLIMDMTASVASSQLSGAVLNTGTYNSSYSIEVPVSQTFTWSSLPYAIHEYNQNLNCDGGNDPYYDTIEVPAVSSGGGSNTFPLGGTASFNVSVAQSPNGREFTFNNISFSAGASKVNPSQVVGLSLSASWNGDPFTLEVGEQRTISVPCRIWNYSSLSWIDVDPIEVTIG